MIDRNLPYLKYVFSLVFSFSAHRYGRLGNGLTLILTCLLARSDSGGQYLDGTCDTTRTVHFGRPDVEMCEAYTRVLQGHVSNTLTFSDLLAWLTIASPDRHWPSCLPQRNLRLPAWRSCTQGPLEGWVKLWGACELLCILFLPAYGSVPSMGLDMALVPSWRYMKVLMASTRVFLLSQEMLSPMSPVTVSLICLSLWLSLISCLSW